MHNNFSCYYDNEVGDSDEKVSVVLRITEREDGIEIHVSRKDATKSGTSFNTRKSEELTLTGLTADQVLDIVQVLEGWLESESFPTIDIDLEDVKGVHHREDPSGYGRGSRSEDTEFQGIKVTVSERSIDFSYWNEREEEWKGVEIPACEAAKHHVPRDSKNVGKLYDTFCNPLTLTPLFRRDQRCLLVGLYHAVAS